MKRMILLIIIVLVGCTNNQTVTLHTDSDKIYLESNNSQYDIFEGDTSQFLLKPNLTTIYKGKNKSFEFIYYGIYSCGSTGLRSFGHVVERDIKSNKFYEFENISADNFIVEQKDDLFEIRFTDIVEKIELAHIKEKYNSSDLKDRESFKDMLEAGTYIIQHNIVLDNTKEKIYVDYDVSNKSFGVYLFTFTIEYSILNDKLEMRLYDVRFLEGEILEINRSN